MAELMGRDAEDVQEKHGLTSLRTIATIVACHWWSLSVHLEINASGGLC